MILNLTQHVATPEQIAQGVVEPANKKEVRELLTFVGIPTQNQMLKNARELVDIALKEGADAVMIGGAPYFMPYLEYEFLFANEHGIKTLYAFSERMSVDEIQPDGSVIKRTVFKHTGFVEGGCAIDQAYQIGQMQG